MVSQKGEIVAGAFLVVVGVGLFVFGFAIDRVLMLLGVLVGAVGGVFAFPNGWRFG